MNAKSVVGYDGSEPSKAALRWALQRDAAVVVVTVTDDDSGMMGTEYRVEQQRRGARLLAEAREAVGGERVAGDVEYVQLDGPVAWALAEFAAHDDLIVVGTHKTGFLHGRVLGSQSVEVAMLARCDVAVIPNADLRFRKGVLAGVDDDVSLDAVVAAAAREAAALDQELLLVHSSVHDESQGLSSVIARATSLARAVAPRIVVRSRTSNRPPAELVLDAGRDRSLIVIGSGGGDRTRSPIGTVLHDVLLNINAPTIVVHAAPSEPERAGTTDRRNARTR